MPITNEKPKYYQVNDINTLIHNVTQAHHPEIIELVPQTNFSLHYNDDTVPSHQFSLHQVYMTNSGITQKTSPLYNVQHTSHTSILEFFLHYHTLLTISNLLITLFFSSLILQTLSILHFAIYHLNIRHVMQHIKMMLAILQLLLVLESNG